MSIKVLNRVWQHSRQKGGALVLLLAIADFADDDGVAFPALETLAKKSRMSERNARYAIDQIVSSGELLIDYNEGRNGTNLYKVTVDTSFSPVNGGKDCPPKKRGRPRKKMEEAGCRGGEAHFKNGGSRLQKWGKPTAPEPSLTVSTPQPAPPTYVGTQGLSTADAEKSAAAACLIFPDKLSTPEHDDARRLLNGVDDPQLLLDELDGKIKAEGVRIPLLMLRDFAEQRRAGSFVPSHAYRVQAERELVQTQTEVKRAASGDT